jgi:hypothetical protein
LFVVGILKFQKWFGVYVLDFQIPLCCRYFGLFMAWQHFEKLGEFFFKSSGHPALEGSSERFNNKFRNKKRSWNGINLLSI